MAVTKEEEQSRQRATGRHVIVVGAGIAGLSAAFRLQQTGCTVTVLERDQHIGGRMHTAAHEGFRMDLCAIWLTRNYREMLQLLSDAGLEGEIRHSTDWIGIVRAGKIHPLRLHRPTDLMRTGLIGWRSKLRAMALMRDARHATTLARREDVTAAAYADTESIRAYSSRRLNRELHDYLIDPLCWAFYLASPDDLSVVNLFSEVKLAFGAPCFSFTYGIDTLAQRLAEQLTVHLNTTVTSIEQRDDTVKVTWQQPGKTAQEDYADACVVTVPGPQVPELIPDLAPEQRRYLSGLTYQPHIGVHVGLDQPPGPPYTTPYVVVAVPSTEDRDLNYLTFDHHRAQGRAPAGQGLVSLHFRPTWNEQHWSRNESEIIDEALAVCRRALPGLARHIDRYRTTTLVHRQRLALLARPPGGYRQLQRFIENLDPQARIQFGGDHLSLSTTNNALATGELAARATHLALQYAPPAVARPQRVHHRGETP
ncbi:NAD(P)/FAD-dependent oxidoreductase [Streptomyces sp. NPDC026294]|uniref:protoporphyrinogen/coproporphyrinogen oxidase n=1 Tax=Streptomyces sp. NPDC026294 TaxID=3155362 RepID=UPI0033F55125